MSVLLLLSEKIIAASASHFGGDTGCGVIHVVGFIHMVCRGVGLK